ncbi:helix-turn-helix transcriptional regulator [Desulfobacula sp.]|uniref:helix-turn-helix transcriptional regulator n=1 Tax=Desulfobacula sp. TaxID=2593537 RepID=UPI0039B8F790
MGDEKANKHRIIELMIDGSRLKYCKDNENELVDITETEWYQKMKEKMTPGKTIRVYRDNMGLTQEQLGKKLGKSRKKISDYENGHRGISKSLALELSDLFKAPVQYFF